MARDSQADKHDKRVQADQARKSNRGSKRTDSSASMEMTPERGALVLVLLTAFMNNGGAVRVGLTRDGGAMALGCYYEEDYGTEYMRPAENFKSGVLAICEAWLPDGEASFYRAAVQLGLEV